MNATYFFETPFELESGEKIYDLKLSYFTFGTLNKERNNVVWVFHALTANANVMEWWEGLFGTSDFFNPLEYFIICVNSIGSPYGSSSPTNLAFPLFTVRDVVRTQIELAKKIDVKSIKVAIGGSYGGNQAIEFAYLFEGVINNLVLIASCAKESAWSIAVHEAQRMAIRADTSFGEENGGKEGLKAARAIGMLTYRTPEIFIKKQTDENNGSGDLKAISYINYQGEKFVKRFNSLAYYYLTKCLDTHDLGRDRGGISHALSKIESNTLVIGIKTDKLIPVDQQKYMIGKIKNACYVEIDSIYGHDGFLVETEEITKAIRQFLKKIKQ